MFQSFQSFQSIQSSLKILKSAESVYAPILSNFSSLKKYFSFKPNIRAAAARFTCG